MKLKNMLAIAVMAGGTALFAYSCQEVPEPAADGLEAGLVGTVRVTTGEEYMGNIRLPAGTKVTVVPHGFEWELPGEWKFVGYDEQGRLAIEDEGGYTCTCSSTGGCDPIYGGSSGYGCLQASCEGSCTGKPDETITSITGGSFVNFAGGIGFVREKDDLGDLYEVPDALFAVAEVQEAMKVWNLQVYGNEDGILPDGDAGVYTMLNFFGTKISYLIPTAKAKELESARSSTLMLEGEPSCSCSSGSSGCTLSRTEPYIKCSAGDCTSCSLDAGGGTTLE